MLHWLSEQTEETCHAYRDKSRKLFIDLRLTDSSRNDRRKMIFFDES